MSNRGLNVPDSGYLGTLNGVPASTAAWSEQDWAKLARIAGKRRRTNIELDGAPGERGYQGDIAAPDPFDMYWLVIGDVDADGLDVADPAAGLEDTLEYLASQWFQPDGDERGTIEAVVFTPKGRTLTVDLQVDEFDPDDGREECLLRLRVQVPTGTQLGTGAGEDSA